MVEGKEELEGAGTPEMEPETPSEGETAPEAPKTYTEEELKARLKEQYDELNKTLSAQGAELKRLRKQLTEAPKVASPAIDAQKILLEEMEARQAETGEPNPRIAALKAEIARLEQQEFIERTTNEWRSKLETRISEAGLDPTDEKFDSVWDRFHMAYYVDGPAGFAEAEKRLERILSKSVPKQEPKSPEGKPEKKTYTEEEVEELKRRWMEEQGLLTSEAGGPSASSLTKKDIAAKFAAGEISEEEAAKYLDLK